MGRKYWRAIAFLPQVLPVPEGMTVRQLVSYGRSLYSGLWGRLGSGDRVAIDSALSQLDIEHISDVQVSDLSGGQRQRVWIAMIVAQQMPIVLMDEPTNYLDINHQIEVLRFARQLAKEGKAVVMVLHDLNQAFRYADVIGGSATIMSSRYHSSFRAPTRRGSPGCGDPLPLFGVKAGMLGPTADRLDPRTTRRNIRGFSIASGAERQGWQTGNSRHAFRRKKGHRSGPIIAQEPGPISPGQNVPLVEKWF